MILLRSQVGRITPCGMVRTTGAAILAILLATSCLASGIAARQLSRNKDCHGERSASYDVLLAMDNTDVLTRCMLAVSRIITKVAWIGMSMDQ